MRDINRIPKMLQSIEAIWAKNPDLRLFQLLLNTTGDARNLYFLEDEELLTQLQMFKIKNDNETN